jgi:serine/threonine-protein kinase
VSATAQPVRRCLTCGTAFPGRRLVCPTDGDLLAQEGMPVADSGRVLGGRYRLGNLLGEGGMGRVFEAVPLAGGDPVAIKLLKTELASAGSDLVERRFQVEAEAGGSIDHPGIVKVLEFSRSHDGPSYIVMERLRGATLDELRRAGKLASLARVVELIREVCAVLAVAHSRNIVHRDLKPSNVFVHRPAKDGAVVKVLDFGIAKFLDRHGDRLTSTGEFLGTLLYMAPEQTAGERVTAGVDVYSLGVILFEAIAGRVPFAGKGPMEIIRLHASMPAPALSTFRPDVSAELEGLVARCLFKKPENRFRDAGELAAALASVRPERAAIEVEEGADTLATRTSASHWVGLVLDDRYEIQEWLTPGRFGSDVYRALHLRTGTSLAVRLWRTGRGAARDCLLEAFQAEARAMAVRHPNLIAIVDLGYNDECVYMVTELVESVSLRALLAARGTLPADLAIALVRGAAGALAALHAKGIVSGGLTPEVLRVAPGAEKPEKLLLTPLGLARWKQVDELLERGPALGAGDRSLEYISPEQAHGAAPDARSDLYSLAAILHEMLAGSPAWKPGETRWMGEAPGRGAGAPAPGEEPRPAEPGMPANGRAWSAFFARALAPDPAARFPDAAAFLAALPGEE